ncbi:hypothetical protein NT6N_23100 [Oceaniferula spumae]|uniref:Uncharacterized protein n=1 Tax=Oceaniferula spumae TaxID=2979115 RepID=A0AAT9FMM1_9BACT
MSDTTSTDPGQTKAKDKGQFSPFAGCSIFIIAGVLAASMIGFTFWIGTRVESTIEGFTTEKPKTIEQTDLQGKETDQVALKSKLVAFRHKMEAQKKGEMTLSAEEMNLAIATFDILKPHRGNLHVTEITDNGISAQISNPINSKMSNILSKDKSYRYLNGTILIQPELVEGAVFPRITTIKPEAGGSVPEEFMQQISKTLLLPFKDDKEVGPIFNRISSVEIQGNTLLLKTDPEHEVSGAPPTDTQPMIERLMKGFAVVAVIFLAIVTAIIILSRRKASQTQS